MPVSGLDSAGDWQFGRGRASYLSRSDEIAQRVRTRLRSFTDDWFADTSHGLPWFDMLGTKGGEARILREAERHVLRTEGVRAITRLQIISVDNNRAASIKLEYIDIFDTRTTDEIPVI